MDQEPEIYKFPIPKNEKAPEPTAKDVGEKEAPLPQFYWYAHVDILANGEQTTCLKRFAGTADCETFIKQVHAGFSNADSLKIVPFHHPDFLAEISTKRKIA